MPLPEDETLLANDEQVVQPSNEASNQPYIRPKWFALRLFTLVALAGLSLFLGGLLMLTLPVIIGRKLIGLWMGDARIHELNTAACGLYAGLLSLRIIMLVASWLPRGWGAILRKLKEGLLICTKTIFAGVILLGVIPLLIGILFDVVIIVPMRVPTNQTPIFYLWQDWAFGVLHAKVICGLAMMGEWRLKQVLEEVSCLFIFQVVALYRPDSHLIVIYSPRSTDLPSGNRKHQPEDNYDQVGNTCHHQSRSRPLRTLFTRVVIVILWCHIRSSNVSPSSDLPVSSFRNINHLLGYLASEQILSTL